MDKRFAIIDIGSSSIKLLVVECSETGIKKILHKQRVEQVLSKNDIHNLMKAGLPEESVKEKIRILNLLKSEANKWKVDKTQVVATEVFRKAENANRIIAEIKNQTGLRVKTISQRQEAELFWKGVCADFPKDMELAAIDIGGGSVEFMYGTASKLRECKLLNTGVYRMKVDLKLNDPYTSEDIENYENRIRGAVKNIKTSFSAEVPFIHGSSEVLNFYAELGVTLKKFNYSKQHPFRVDFNITRKWYEKLRALSIAERKKLSPSFPGYAHGAVLGLANVLIIAEKTGLKFELPSNNNITNGIVIGMLES